MMRRGLRFAWSIGCAALVGAACANTTSTGGSGAVDAGAPLPDASPFADASDPSDATSSSLDATPDGVATNDADDGGGACHAASAGPMPPDAGDVTYAYAPGSAPACFSSPLCQIDCKPAVSLVEGLLACAPVQGGYFWLFGSSYIRVHGIDAGSCVYDISLEIEGGVKYLRCNTPLPVKAWSGLSFYAAVGAGSPTGGDLSTGLEGCETIANCGPTGCETPDGSVSADAGPPNDTPGCPGGGTPPDWC